LGVRVEGWSWDPSLYEGSAAYYSIGRVPYPQQLADDLADALELDGTGILLDVGCGPGSLTLLLAPHVAEAIGVDADPDMLAEASRLASERGIANVRWHQLRAEQLPADLPAPRLVTFAQSFHWLDRPRVAAIVRDMLEPGGAVVHIHATTHQGVDSDPGPNPDSRVPREAIETLVRRYLGPDRRAGKGVRPAGPDNENAIYLAAGFAGPRTLEIPGWTVERTTEQIVASVYSLSWCAPHLFGDRLAEFDADLRRLLDEANPDGRFVEQMRSIAAGIWRR
jgi:SAM-dependent methyltransferase